ncbi:sulfonate ABC transporter substrate-binding protein [Salirhabdus salicampi]|uniref:sulfonate ABC transporter substrate-binding protein n=1 Tax=Salirhabdus salicampi TaxID=476102 RepID=UPI0020C2FA70|nr:sulfonate ABC transporter substrate-binding protein [Salirhabdus salicampi]MCP8615875.1 sulfonate ABC transporter substrate-binding protein [Salirhabdus salicampi]
MKKLLSLRVMVLLFFVAGTLLVGCNQSGKTEGDKDNVVVIGYQKNCPLVILKSLGTLEERLEEIGYTVEWKLFQAGPALLEALNAGSIDFGRTGNTPPIFAQASNAPIAYVSAGKPKFKGSAILVPEDSPVESLEDLKGKTVAFAKGSSSHYFTVKALESAGLSYDDITPAFLPPGDGRIAFETGSVDAWTVWDPYTASAQIDADGRALVDGERYTTDRDFFIATSTFASEHKEALDVLLNEIQRSSDWANENHDELIPMLAEELGISEEAVEMAVTRRVYGLDPLTKDIIDEQQSIADLFYELGIIPKKLNVRDVIPD